MDIVTTTEELRDVCEELARSPYVTVDTEFLRESTYWPILCLIQMATDDVEVIVDPMADGIDLAPFFDLMGAPDVLKVFHAARQDVEIVHHLSGLVPAPMFDTQVAASVCGYGDSVGYGQLVEKLTDGRIDKTSQFTDWSRRPLSEKQLSYALSDVTWLRDVYCKLERELKQKRREGWMEEEMRVLLDPATYVVEPEDAWKRIRKKARKPREQVVMEAVAEWREEQAQRRDVPRGRILKDDAVFEIAQQQPSSVEQLGRLRAVPNGFERSRHADGLMDAIEDALAVPDDELPKVKRSRPPSEATQAASELLKVLLRIVAERESVSARVIASADEVAAIAADDEADVPAMKGWRLKMFGEPALALKRGEIALGFDGRRAELIELEPEEGSGANA